MTDKIYDIPPQWKTRALIDEAKYQEMYARSIEDPDGFWADAAKRLDWYKAPTRIKNASFGPGDVSIKWFEDGVLNAAYNCIDRHLATRAEQTAIIWEGDDPSQSRHISYQELHDEVCKLANILRNRNVEKGDRVTIYLPMIPEAAYAMLACARIGAVHSVVFGGFSPDSLAGRIEDCGSKVVITADEGVRGGRKIPLKANTDAAIAKVGGVDHVIVVRRTGAAGRDGSGARRLLRRGRRGGERRMPVRAHERRGSAVHPLHLGLDRQAEGRAAHHRRLSYVYVAMTHEYVFDYHDGDIYWCTADVGWVTGHSYIVYGPLANGATTLMFEGVPNYPTMSRFWEVIDKHKVNTFYTAPTAIRALMQAGDAPVKKTSRKSLQAARHRRRADQSGSLGVVPPRGRRRPLPDRRHLVADRDRRHPDHAAAGRDPAQAGVGDQAVLRHRAGDRGCRRQGAGRRRDRQPLHRAILARPDAHRLRRPPALRRHLFQGLSRQVLHRRRLPARRRTAITGSPAASTT